MNDSFGNYKESKAIKVQVSKIYSDGKTFLGGMTEKSLGTPVLNTNAHNFDPREGNVLLQ